MRPLGLGLYILYRHDEIIFIGTCAASIRARLFDHLEGKDEACKQSATHYRCEESQDLGTEQDHLIEEYKARYGVRPKCNENPFHVFLLDSSGGEEQ